ncbi:putative quinol monooxygenase [Microbacterium dauci]|uniref:Antibiotic biosynthesis monooxygenase n=1 Tax=Microbacterium dauci TaxID=3048008 RepID=A0ABT6ZH53_9MICO|nr:antibiotic biosynthesis monooxygenase [Microbacterium sp. LX3-4]MDJ1115492.1 antibiotic biosynthesis monooxygenase [Microbacterium sp. LX3-4]
MIDIGGVRLSGRMICRNDDEAAAIRAHLDGHIAATRAEPGCLLFEVTPIGGGRIWSVEEIFVDADSFRAHQARTAASEWGRATVGIERAYRIEGMPRD